MSASNGTKAVVAALLANLGIAVSKFIAWAVSGSASMLAEAIHSVADAGNQGLLLLGGKKSKKQATETHPFGYGRERYIYAFLVAIVLFSLGGLFSIYEGYSKLRNPHELENAAVPLTVLIIAIILESLSLRTAIKESNLIRGKESWVNFVRHAKAPELPVVLLEDFAALLGLIFALFGVGMTVITGNPIFDAIGTLLIGILLITVAIILAVETKSLLLGEGASKTDVLKIQNSLIQTDGVKKIIHLKTLYLGPDELMVAAKISLNESNSMSEVAQIINASETNIRSAVNIARVIYLEPDVYKKPNDKSPDTESIITRSYD